MPIQTVKLWDGKNATHSMLQTHKMHADIANVQMWCIHKFELGTWFRRNECVSHDLKQRAGIFWYGRAFLERAVSNMCFWTCSRRSLGSVIGASIQTKLWLGKKRNDAQVRIERVNIYVSVMVLKCSWAQNIIAVQNTHSIKIELDVVFIGYFCT